MVHKYFYLKMFYRNQHFFLMDSIFMLLFLINWSQKVIQQYMYQDSHHIKFECDPTNGL